MIQTCKHLSVLTALTVVMTALSPIAQANEPGPRYQGVYTGISIGKQNYFGGAFLDDLDVLSQKSARLIDLSAGWRTPLSEGWVLAIEGAYGIADGNLFLQNANYTIDYQNEYQLSGGLIAGKIVGQAKNWMLFAYSYFTLRKFDIQISSATGSFSQQDEQGVWRYGLGLERRLLKNWSVRASLGQTYVDLGGLKTNIEVNDKADAMIGLVYQF